jgi:4-aminobutyrate aminotransferase
VELAAQSLYQLELLLAQQSAPTDTAAIILEPVLGEGGYVPAPPAFLAGLRKVCDEHGIMLMVDEVQTGFGRTGKFFAVEYSGVTPDILIMAKVHFCHHRLNDFPADPSIGHSQRLSFERRGQPKGVD